MVVETPEIERHVLSSLKNFSGLPYYAIFVLRDELRRGRVGLLGRRVSAVTESVLMIPSKITEIVDIPGALLLDGESSEPLAHVDGAFESLALGNTSEEASGEGVTSTGGVGDLGLVDLVNREGLDVVFTLDGNDSGLSALGDDGDTLALLVLLGKVGEVLSDGRDVSSLEVMGLGVGGSLGLVANDVVPVRSSLVELVLEELGNERCVQGESEGLQKVSLKDWFAARIQLVVPCSPWQPPRPEP